MKTILTTTCALLALGLFAEPATNATPVAAAPATTNAAAAAGGPSLREEGTDEIDLEEIDDAAIAAKKATVKASGDAEKFVDISCDEATLADILRQFRKTTRANIISDDSTNLQKRVSAELTHVPWLEALTSILNSRGYTIEERKGIHYVKEIRETNPVFTRSFVLKHASAKELADLFNSTYAPKDKAGKITAPIANSFEGANVVVVTATENIINDCAKIIEAVDKAVAQIYIEARFLELSTEAAHQLGMQWNQLQSWGVSVKELKGGISRNDSTLAQGGTISESERTGYTAEELNWSKTRGFSGQLSADDFRIAMSAFEQIEDAKIFSNPKVIVSNGKEANVDMTTKFPNIRLTSNRDTSTTTPYMNMSAQIEQIPGEDAKMFSKSCFFSWGIMLTVKPRISPDGLITVEITPTISQLDKETGVSDTGFYEAGNGEDDSSPVGFYPIIQMKRITTEFTMKNGATAVIGGLSKTSEEDVDSGIPYLRKIPWIGPKLFGWKSRQKVQKEIIVCVTLGIANPADLPKGIGLPTNAILGREYVTGKKLEPGDRVGETDELLLKLDKTAIDARVDERDHEKRKAEVKKQDKLKAGEVRMSVSSGNKM